MPTPPIQPQPCRSYAWACAALIALMACACSLLVVPTASATDYTWQGGGSSTSWSNGGNWLGGSAPAPSSTIGTLTLPPLPSLQDAENDLSGLSINHLKVDDSHGYTLTGQGFSLGGGGLSIGPSEGSAGSFIASTPMTLSGNQTWSVSQHIILGEALSGETSDLTMNISGATQFYFGDPYPGSPFGPLSVNNELGNVVINGSAPGASGNLSSVVYLTGGKFNADNGHLLTVHNVQLDSGAATGPLTASDSGLFLGVPASGPVTLTGSQFSFDQSLTVPSLSLDEHSTLKSYIVAQGTTPGTDYDQLTSTGSVTLGGATLEAIGVGTNNGTECPPPIVGQVDTLISTTGSLIGTFGNAPNGSTIVTFCLPTDRWYSYRVNYHTSSSPETVTLTALPAVPTFGEPPTISGTATQGQTLSATHGYWTNSPSGYADQWQRCDPSGNNCQSIVGATAQTYTLTAADAGSTIRVEETASNAEGSSTPAVSAPTAVVQASGSGKQPPVSCCDGLPKLPPISCCDYPQKLPSPAQLRAILTPQLLPARSITIGSLLKHGGLSMPVSAPETGSLSVQWLFVPGGAKLAKHTKPKPVLIASGRLTLSASRAGLLKLKLTAQGKHLLKHARRMKLVVKGVFTPSGGTPVSISSRFQLKR